MGGKPIVFHTKLKNFNLLGHLTSLYQFHKLYPYSIGGEVIFIIVLGR